MMTKLKSSNPWVILVVGDLLVILSFVWIGRGTHSLAVTDVVAAVSTALPFVLTWFVITPWFGIYKVEVSQDWRKLVPRLLLAWALAGPLALVLRALTLGRPIPSGIIPAFAIISLAYIGLIAVVWRLGYIWWVNRSLDRRKDVGGSKP